MKAKKSSPSSNTRIFSLGVVLTVAVFFFFFNGFLYPSPKRIPTTYQDKDIHSLQPLKRTMFLVLDRPNYLFSRENLASYSLIQSITFK